MLYKNLNENYKKCKFSTCYLTIFVKSDIIKGAKFYYTDWRNIQWQASILRKATE